MARLAKPKPVPHRLVCSECGLPWPDHGENPTLATCVALLRAEVDRRAPYQITWNPAPAWNPSPPYYTTWGTGTGTSTASVTYLRPRPDDPDDGVPARVS